MLNSNTCLTLHWVKEGQSGQMFDCHQRGKNEKRAKRMRGKRTWREKRHKKLNIDVLKRKSCLRRKAGGPKLQHLSQAHWRKNQRRMFLQEKPWQMLKKTVKPVENKPELETRISTMERSESQITDRSDTLDLDLLRRKKSYRPHTQEHISKEPPQKKQRIILSNLVD